MKNRKLQNNPTNLLEVELLNGKYKRVIGIDEAGRGCWAGPIAFASFTYQLSDKPILGVKDSKLLAPAKRALLFKEFPQRYKVVMIEPKVIDEIGLSRTISLAINELLEDIDTEDTIVLIDGNYKLNLKLPYKSIIAGDRLHYSIACASIAAKVSRDNIMDAYDKQYSQYSFASNKGYGTIKHQQALDKYGITPIHRLSFAPVRKILNRL